MQKAKVIRTLIWLGQQHLRNSIVEMDDETFKAYEQSGQAQAVDDDDEVVEKPKKKGGKAKKSAPAQAVDDDDEAGPDDPERGVSA